MWIAKQPESHLSAIDGILSSNVKLISGPNYNARFTIGNCRSNEVRENQWRDMTTDFIYVIEMTDRVCQNSITNHIH